MTKLLKAAIAGLGINVPIYRTEEQDGILILYLYGGRVLRWPRSQRATPDVSEPGEETSKPRPEVSESAKETSKEPSAAPADFTIMPYVGQATAKALHGAGYRTFPDLIAATDTALLDLVNSYTLTKIRDYLAKHFT